MTAIQWLGVVCLLVMIAGAMQVLFLRGVRRQREESAYLAMKNIAGTPPITKHIHRFPEMSKPAAKGIQPRDPVVMRDQVSRSERMGH